MSILLTQRMMDSPEPPPAFNDFWTSGYGVTEWALTRASLELRCAVRRRCQRARV